LILAVAPLWPAPRPAQAQGFWGRLSKVVPFAGVVVGWSQRNRVYRDANRFIRDRNQYYDGLLDIARRQYRSREITTVGRTRTAAYVKVYAMIEQERDLQLVIAEARKRQARSQFHDRVEDAVLYAVAGGRLAQELLGSMLKGVDSMQQLLDKAVGKLTSGGSDALQDLRRTRDIAGTVAQVSSMVGGRAGGRLAAMCARIAGAIDQAEMGAVDIAGMVHADLQELTDVLTALKELGRKPSAGEVIDRVTARFLPDSKETGSVPLEAIAALVSEMQVGDGSLKDEARRALSAGFAARCAEYSKGLETQLDRLKKSGQAESEPGTPACKAVKKPGQQAEADSTLDELLEMGEEPEKLPRVTASGTLSESMSGALTATQPMGTTFQLTADLDAGTINGTLKGSRTSTPGGWMNCYDLDDPSIEYERIDVDTTESYTASYSGSIDKESGEFSIAIAPAGGTSARKQTLFIDERCIQFNSKKYSGDQGWTGKGTISGGVSKDGGIEFTTDWSYTWFKGQVQVSGRWSGNGIVSNP